MKCYTCSRPYIVRSVKNDWALELNQPHSKNYAKNAAFTSIFRPMQQLQLNVFPKKVKKIFVDV